ncbi:hypothetical protein POKO110462_06740 [Pontibacter korlensis]
MHQYIIKTSKTCCRYVLDLNPNNTWLEQSLDITIIEEAQGLNLTPV